jgi:hypothetical protein
MTRTAAARKADRIDYWIRRHAIQSCYETYPSQSSRDRRIGLSAIGQCLKDQYDALATPNPPHLAALVNQLEDTGTGIGRSTDWLKMKNAAAPAVKREEEEDWGKKKWR